MADERADDETIDERALGAGAPTQRDFDWVFQNVDDERARQEDAPSPGAWWLLLRARENDKAYEHVLKACAKVVGVEDRDTAGDPALELNGLRNRILTQWGEAAEQLGIAP